MGNALHDSWEELRRLEQLLDECREQLCHQSHLLALQLDGGDVTNLELFDSVDASDELIQKIDREEWRNG